MVLLVPLNISVNLTDQTFYRLKSQKSGKIPKFLMYYLVPLKDCWKQYNLKLGMVTPT